jgi:hypothetical protein
MKSDKYLKYLDSMIASMNNLKDTTIKVGWVKPGPEHYGDNYNYTDPNKTVTEVALQNELGIGVPRRSALRDTFNTKKQEVNKVINKNLTYFFSNERINLRNLNPVLKNIGLNLKQYVVEAFNTSGYGRWKPLSEATVEEKKRSKLPQVAANANKALVASEFLKENVEYKIVKKGGNT